MTWTPLLETRAGGILVMKSTYHICYKGLLLFTGSFLLAFLTLITKDTHMCTADGNLYRSNESL